ncbi:GT4 family glycosyltransferase PelF [Rheinheimera pleomorphica]|uniref:GT4 family glycosyltransferase PelF n=1 Tax=Rheinheimera pleomorphica TaxID=2703963 RepID=UPI00141E1B4A|nr:GT4 family glycosyltransferase PelF [Rheinheimera pleomorphica]
MQQADICLLLEGTYPYVRGGVSSWVHQLITGLPHYTFYLVFVGGTKESYGEQRYTLPDNVLGLETHFIMQHDQLTPPRAREGKAKAFGMWQQVLARFNRVDQALNAEQLQLMLNQLGQRRGLTYEDFLYSEFSWHILVDLYLQQSPDQSFVDFFWTFRNIYTPLFSLVKIARQVPPARILHSISTGYAGFLGALLKQRLQVPYLLSEHGIYTKERKIDLTQASWIQDRHFVLDTSIHKKMEQTRQTWISFFEQLGKTAYQHANHITALYQGNRERQIADGAPAEKTEIIVNGINLSRFAPALQQRPTSPPKVVGLIGRVVPIKDIKTFIRAIRVAVNSDPTLQGWIIGPTDEDPNYVKECELLINSLSLNEQVKFLGMQNVVEILPKLGICMLTSISEAQPLVLLEAMAAGVPCIATDVGSCRDIIEGMQEEDQALGRCGYVIGIADPNQGSQAILQTLGDTQNWHRMSEAGYTRVSRYYQEQIMFTRFNQLYESYI